MRAVRARTGRPRRVPGRRTRRLAARSALAAAALLLVLAGLAFPAPAGAVDRAGGPARADGALSPADGTAADVPLFAYFYQWFIPSSWDRAKADYPLVGRYSSDDAHVLREQVQLAKAAGIDGFLTSWKDTPQLDRRLDLLLRVARGEQFDVGVVYQSLDFSRRPLPVRTVERDMVYLLDRWGDQLASTYYGRPVIVWTGTDQYTTADIHAVSTALGKRAYLLASSHSVAGYERVARLVDGLAYYWSSADPTSTMTTTKLLAMSAAVHANRGIWLAPAASGYDGRTLGGTRVIPRDDGRTLVRSLANAYASEPDGVALISWNEWSENTYVEPGEKYGQRELVRLKGFLLGRGESVPPGLSDADARRTDPAEKDAPVRVGLASAGTGSGWTGARAALTLGVLSLAAVPCLRLVGRRREARDWPGRHRRERVL